MFKESIEAYKFAKIFKKYKNSKDEVEKVKAAKLLSKTFEQQGGIFLKVAQYLGTKKEEAQQIQDLATQMDPVLSFEEFVELLEKNLNLSWQEVFEEIEKRGKSASIGQVHKGILKENKEQVAIKIQYPGIEKKLHSQLKLLNLIPTSVPEKKWGIDINRYKKMIKELLDHEIDYPAETRMMQKGYELFSDYSFIKTPKVFDDLCSEKMIVSSYLEGFHVDEILHWSYEQKRDIGENLLKSFLLMIEKRFFQGDSNHGNFIFLDKKGTVGLIDFGQYKILDEDFSKAMINLLDQMVHEQPINYGSYFVALGFEEKKLIKIQSSLEVLAKIIFDPFLKDIPYSLKDWKYKEKIDLCLGEDKWWFRSAGGEEFFLLMKSFMGLKNLIDKLDVNINWQKIFLEVKSSFDPSIFDFTPPDVSRISTKLPTMGKSLQVHMTENGEDKVNLTLPINVLFELEDILGDELVEKLNTKDINVGKIAQESIRGGAAIGEVLSYEDDKKIVHISIK